MLARCIYREEHDDTHVEIWEEGDRRSLWFDDVILQTEIYLHDAAVLPNPVNRFMLAHLMFGLPLRRVLLAGCGGGAIARWFHARAPEIRGEAVELSPVVARLAREYFDFPDPSTSGWSLRVEDVREYVVHSEFRYDFVLLDLEEAQSTPDWLTGNEFLDRCRRRLSPQGVLTLNLIVNETTDTGVALQQVREVFGPDILLLTEPDHDNLLVMVFRGMPPESPDDAQLARRGQRWGMDFRRMAARITRLSGDPPGDPGMG
ncbi:MAG: fused MFS/spermidine synthase [Chromatiaceae bacterium]|nr:fused MFS/spermidine synthase [Gammaproteobacteria bacterium]MCP5422930.1 fused MFS/spermidine synthase [Chromatiaceae bacterium]